MIKNNRFSSSMLLEYHIPKSSYSTARCNGFVDWNGALAWQGTIKLYSFKKKDNFTLINQADSDRK